jgi:hypothetical protein
MDVPQSHNMSCQSGRMVLEIAAVATLASFIVFGALATIVQMDNDLIASESNGQAVYLSRPEIQSHSIILTADAHRRTRSYPDVQLPHVSLNK